MVVTARLKGGQVTHGRLRDRRVTVRISSHAERRKSGRLAGKRYAVLTPLGRQNGLSPLRDGLRLAIAPIAPVEEKGGLRYCDAYLKALRPLARRIVRVRQRSIIPRLTWSRGGPEKVRGEVVAASKEGPN